MRYKKNQTVLIELLPLEVLERIAEIKFYRICEKFFRVQGDIGAMFNFIECVAVLGSINIEALKVIAQKVTFNADMAPSKKEMILLMVLEKFSSNEITETLHCSKRDISEVKNLDADNNLRIRPRSTPSDLKEILRFMGVFEQLQNIKYN